jgi:hypothetical protein
MAILLAAGSSLDALDRGISYVSQACRPLAWWNDGWQKLSQAPYRAMARLGSWIEPFPEGIYVKPADALDRSLAAQGRALRHPRPCRSRPRRP